jgi:hypothetical protein
MSHSIDRVFVIHYSGLGIISSNLTHNDSYESSVEEWFCILLFVIVRSRFWNSLTTGILLSSSQASDICK